MENLLSPLFGLVAFFYALVGHGGASGYLGLGSLAGLSPQDLKVQALVLNLVVAGFSAVAFTKAGHLRLRLLLPLILLSIPTAYLGARVALSPAAAKALLGFCLSIAAMRLAAQSWLAHRAVEKSVVAPPVVLLAVVGAGLGYLSGLTGVGGGIYLSPILLLVGWASVKETAAVSAWFIWLNSASGVIGAASLGPLPDLPVEWLVAAGIGGLLGSRLGAFKWKERPIRNVLAGLLLFAGVKLALTGLRGM